MSFALKPINQKIQKELARRAKALSRDSSAISGIPGSQNNISNELRTLNSRTTWIRWISGDDKPAVILGGLALTTGTGTETLYNLAKGFKEVYVPPNTPTRLGTSSILYKPIAGVKSVSTGFEGATKSVKKVTIEWTVFDLDELEVLTPHFLSPGKYTMLEFGWNYDNQFRTTLHGDNLLNAIHGDKLSNEFNSLEEIIWNNGGNYECVTGVISNFEYTLRGDGGFDCTTTLTTHGISLLDATIDSPSYPVESFLGDDPTTDPEEKEEQSRSSDVFKLAVEKLGEYFRTRVSTLTENSPYYPNGNFWLSSQNDGDYKFYGNENFFLRCKPLKDTQYVYSTTRPENKDSWTYALEQEVPTWVRWGWFEDNVISKYLGFATYEVDPDTQTKTFKEIKLQFRSIENIPKIDARSTLNKTKDDAGEEISVTGKESVRIISHRNLLTTDINKFILVGKTPTLEMDAQEENEATGKFLNSNIDKLRKFEVEKTNIKANSEGYLRNVYFNVKFLQEKIAGTVTLRQAIDNIWGAFNTEYQNYWDFKIVGNDQEMTTVKIVDNNNPLYNVSEFRISNIEDNLFSCYQFPTWTKESIVKNMEYSVAIPSSQTAVAALAGGELSPGQPAERHKGDINVQQYQKFLRKSFDDNKGSYFKNTDRIKSIKFGQIDGDENEKLGSEHGIDFFTALVHRGITFNSAIDSNNPEYKADYGLERGKLAATVGVSIFQPKSVLHPWFTGESLNKPLYNGGQLAALGTYLNPKKSMWNKLHAGKDTAKTVLFDLLNGIAEIKLTIDGIAGIFPGDAFTSKHLPNHLLKPVDGINGEELPLIFQTTNVEQELTSNGWNTTISGMPRLNSNGLYEKGTLKKPSKKPPKVEEVGNDITEFRDSRNILGMGGYALALKMETGIYLPLPKDPYFYINSTKEKIDRDNVVDARIGEIQNKIWKSSYDTEVKKLAKSGNSPTTVKNFPFGLKEKTGEPTATHKQGDNAGTHLVFQPYTLHPEDINFGFFNDGSGGRRPGKYGTATKFEGSPWREEDAVGNLVFRAPVEEYQRGRNPIIKFTSQFKVEEALWFSMYQGILMALPPMRTANKDKPHILDNLSQDGTYKNMSYHLFKGMKKSNLTLRRKILSKNGIANYTPEYMAEFKKFGGYAPCAFDPTNGKNRTLFEFDKKILHVPKTSYRKIDIERKGLAFDLKGVELYIMKLTTQGIEEFRIFFKNMYNAFAGEQLDSMMLKNGGQQMKDTFANSEVSVSIFDNLDKFMEKEKIGGVDKFGVDKHIEMFLQGMNEYGIIIIPDQMYIYNDGAKVVGKSAQKRFIEAMIEGPVKEDKFFTLESIVGRTSVPPNSKEGKIWYKKTIKEFVKGFTGSYNPFKNRGPHFYVNYRMSAEEIGLAPPTKGALMGMRSGERKDALDSHYAQMEKEAKKLREEGDSSGITVTKTK